MKSLNYKFLTQFIVLVLLATLTVSKQIQVPALQDNNPFMLKLGATKVVDQPDFDFQNIYKRQVSKVDGIANYRFAPCEQYKAEVQFTVLDQIIFEGIPKRPTVFYNFQDIRYSQFLLDIYYEEQELTLYIMFKNHRIAIVKLSSDSSIDQVKLVTVQGTNLNKNQYLQIGYFIKVGSNLLFVNNNYSFKITKEGATTLQGYQNSPDFQSVIPLGDGLFAVAQTSIGIKIFKFQGQKIIKLNQFKKQDLGKYRNQQLNNTEAQGTQGTPQLQIMDIAYWSQRQMLIVLDRMTGISSYKVAKTQNNVTLSQQESIGRDSSVTRECKLMYLYNSSLYVYCGRIRLYELEKWPIIQQVAVPYPNVEVKQIYKYQKLIAFVGKNSFTLMYLGRIVNYFQDANMDKLLILKNFFISADEEGVDIGHINIIDTYISCYTQNQDFLGTTNLMFKTTAQCNETYFKKFGVNVSQLGQIKEQDQCVYTVYKPINIWKAGQIKTYPFIIALVIILVIVIVVILLFLYKKMEVNRYMSVIQEMSRSQASASAQPQKIVQQLEGDLESKPKKVNNGSQGKQSQVQLGNVVHHEI